MDSKREMLKRALDENLEIELNKIPEDRIIKKSHTFSTNFEKEIGAIEDSFQDKHARERTIKKENPFRKGTVFRRWIYIGATLAASVILILAIWRNDGFDYFINIKLEKTETIQEAQDKLMENAGEIEVAEANTEALLEGKDAIIGNDVSVSEDVYAEDDNLTGITGNETANSETTKPEIAGSENGTAVVLQSDQMEYLKSDIVTLTITNNSEKEVTYGESISLELWENDEWIDIPANFSVCGMEPVNIILPGESTVLKFSLEAFTIKKEDATYRILKNIDEERYYIVIEIVKDTIP